MTLEKILFYVMAFIVLGSAIFAASTKNLVRSVFMFFITLFALAGLYVLALADFVAVTQIVIYVGGILVLILFAFMLSGKETLNTLQNNKSGLITLSKAPAFILAGFFFLALVNMILKIQPDTFSWIMLSGLYENIIKPNQPMTANIGVNLMTRYLLPFEAISILLMIALIGSAHLSRKEGVR